MRALNEYFVGGIKTNISLFRRILEDPDFQAGRLDTGFLDRLLAQKQTNGDLGSEKTVAAVAAGVFALLDANPVAVNGNSATKAFPQEAPSNWKRVGRVEGLQ
jgi:acetyl-CoA carboxylase biotin carboxylase subunit